MFQHLELAGLYQMIGSARIVEVEYFKQIHQLYFLLGLLHFSHLITIRRWDAPQVLYRRAFFLTISYEIPALWWWLLFMLVLILRHIPLSVGGVLTLVNCNLFHLRFLLSVFKHFSVVIGVEIRQFWVAIVHDAAKVRELLVHLFVWVFNNNYNQL